MLDERLAAAPRSCARARAGLRVRSSPERLGQIVDNLVANAVAVSRRPSRVSVARDDGWVELHVVDRGPGLTAEERSACVRPVLARPLDAARGSGLGLAIVRRLARADGGDAEPRAGARGRGRRGRQAEAGVAVSGARA